MENKGGKGHAVWVQLPPVSLPQTGLEEWRQLPSLPSSLSQNHNAKTSKIDSNYHIHYTHWYTYKNNSGPKTAVTILSYHHLRHHLSHQYKSCNTNCNNNQIRFHFHSGQPTYTQQKSDDIYKTHCIDPMCWCAPNKTQKFQYPKKQIPK